MLAPKQEFGGTISQGAGSDGFWRTSVRVDSGLLSTGTAFFVSGSWTEANKWKGDGDASRKECHVRRQSENWATIWISRSMASTNDQQAYSYLPLTYAQTTMMFAYAWADYNTQLVGRPKIDNNEYLFNQTRYANNAI